MIRRSLSRGTNVGFKWTSNTLNDILFNTDPDYEYAQTTFLIWAYQRRVNSTGLTNPIFSNYSNNIPEEQHRSWLLFWTSWCIW